MLRSALKNRYNKERNHISWCNWCNINWCNINWCNVNWCNWCNINWCNWCNINWCNFKRQRNRCLNNLRKTQKGYLII